MYYFGFGTSQNIECIYVMVLSVKLVDKYVIILSKEHGNGNVILLMKYVDKLQENSPANTVKP